MAKLRKTSDGQYIFHCPGCKYGHGVYVDGAGHPVWGWNNSLDNPTFTPSILVHSTELTEKGQADYDRWQESGFPKLDEQQEFESRPTVCHSFVVNGQIQFLTDSTHALSGQTVAIPEWEQ